MKEDMLKKKKTEINEKTMTLVFVLLAFVLLTVWAMTQPFDSGPDEHMRYLVADYTSIMEHSRGEMIRKSEIRSGAFPMRIIRSCPIWFLRYL